MRRCVYALVDEGARILGEGVADSAADIDTIWTNGYGFPKARGGPMCYADALGTPDVLEGVRRFERALGPRYWTPAPLLRELAASGDTFQSWQLRRAPPEGSS